jgi:hypothetical protein
MFGVLLMTHRHSSVIDVTSRNGVPNVDFGCAATPINLISFTSTPKPYPVCCFRLPIMVYQAPIKINFFYQHTQTPLIAAFQVFSGGRAVRLEDHIVRHIPRLNAPLHASTECRAVLETARAATAAAVDTLRAYGAI